MMHYEVIDCFDSGDHIPIVVPWLSLLGVQVGIFLKFQQMNLSVCIYAYPWVEFSLLTYELFSSKKKFTIYAHYDL